MREVPNMLSARRIIIAASTTMSVVVFSIVTAGCGSQSDEFDKSALYTPESLAQEFILRFRELNPDARVSSRSTSSRSKSALISRKSPEKKVITKTTKNRAAATIDDVLDDIKHKLTLIPGTTPAEATKKMIETISGDQSLSDGDKKTLTEFVGRLAD